MLHMRALSRMTKSNDPLHVVITETIKLWRRAHLTYDQTRYVAKEVRRALTLTAPTMRARVVARLSGKRNAPHCPGLPDARRPRAVDQDVLPDRRTGLGVRQYPSEEVYCDEQMLLLAHAKGGKQRYVPLLPELAHELRTYLRDRTQGYLFETIRHTRYSPRRIQQLVQETAALAGIDKRVHPHFLRHSVATTLLERGMPLEQIQKFLGHAKLQYFRQNLSCLFDDDAIVTKGFVIRAGFF